MGGGHSTTQFIASSSCQLGELPRNSPGGSKQSRDTSWCDAADSGGKDGGNPQSWESLTAGKAKARPWLPPGWSPVPTGLSQCPNSPAPPLPVPESCSSCSSCGHSMPARLSLQWAPHPQCPCSRGGHTALSPLSCGRVMDVPGHRQDKAQAHNSCSAFLGDVTEENQLPIPPVVLHLCATIKSHFSSHCLLVYYQSPLRFCSSMNINSSIIYIMNKTRKISQGCYESWFSWQNSLALLRINTQLLFLY